MNRKVVLSKRASLKLEELLEYLESEWSVKTKVDFVNKLDKKLNLIKSNPECSPQSNFIKGLRKCVVTKQTTIYYKYDKFKVYIVTLFDNRQDPRRLKKEIKE